MTRIVPLKPGLSAVVASGPQYGVKYTLVGADGSRVTFNDPSDADHVGWLSNISGLDSADVREAADDLVGDDGGVHGNFFYGRRPVVIEGLIDNVPSANHYVLDPGPLTYTNLVLNPSAEVNVAGIAASGSSSVVRSTAQTNGGTASFLVTAGGTVSYSGPTTQNNPFDIPIQPNTTYTLSGYARPAVATNRKIAFYLQSYQADGTTLITSATASVNVAAANTWQFHQMTATTPANAAYAKLYWRVETIDVTNIPTGELAYFDLLQLTATPAYTGYFDGSTYPTLAEGQLYTAWEGTPHYSRSFRFDDVERVNFEPNQVRNIRMTTLQRATNAMRNDSTLSWTPEGGVNQQIKLRRQQPLRITGNYNKTFQAAMVAEDPRLYAAALNETRLLTPSSNTTVTNVGTMQTPPVIQLFGPSSGTMNTMRVRNMSTGQTVDFAPAYTLGVGQSITIDFNARTVTRESGVNIYDQVQFATSSWWQIQPGDNLIRWEAAGTTTAASMVVRWQDAWV